MDPDVRELVSVVKNLVDKVDGLLCHYTAIDADYGRLRDDLANHEHRLLRLERDRKFEPEDRVGEHSSLYPIIKR